MHRRSLRYSPSKFSSTSARRERRNGIPLIEEQKREEKREETWSYARDYWYDRINRLARPKSRIIKLNFSRISLSGGRQDADVLPIPAMNAQRTWRVHQVSHVSRHIKSRGSSPALRLTSPLPPFPDENINELEMKYRGCRPSTARGNKERLQTILKLQSPMERYLPCWGKRLNCLAISSTCFTRFSVSGCEL